MNSKFYEELEAKREKAREDKCDLFDFYNDNWDVLIERLQILEERNTDLATDKIILENKLHFNNV